MKLTPELKDVMYINNGMRGKTDIGMTALLENHRGGDH
jgi:hypothetical protein